MSPVFQNPAPQIVRQTPVKSGTVRLTVSTVRVKRGYYGTVIFDDSADKSAAGKVLPSHEHEGRTFGPYVIDRMNHRAATRDEAMEQHREALYAARTEEPKAVASPRDEFVAGLRAFADFLEQNPGVKTPGDQRMLLALTTNDAAEAFAAEHDLPVMYDAEGNASCDLKFGPVVYHAYGYVDFNKHCEQNNEQRARNWAEAKGLAIVPQAEGGAR